MDRFFESPEAAARSDDPGEAISEVRLVSHSPDDQCAVVLVDYNGSEPYVELCEWQEAGWVSRFGVSGGGKTWLGTGDAGNSRDSTASSTNHDGAGRVVWRLRGRPRDGR